MKNLNMSQIAKLRKKAEEQLEDPMSKISLPDETDNLKLIHELQLHQIELKMQAMSFRYPDRAEIAKRRTSAGKSTS
jgi:threonyl-tRNA synthetase